MTSRETIAGLVQHILKNDKKDNHDACEGLASYIEHGGDLSDIGKQEREILARLVRRQSPRKPGQRFKDKQGRDLEWRDFQICCDIAYLHGNGLPIETESRYDKSVSAVEYPAKDAVTVVASTWGLEGRTVAGIWYKRDKNQPKFKCREKMGRRSKEFAW